VAVDVVRVYQDHAGAWRWRRTADNGKIVADGAEGYLHREECYGEARKVNGPDVTYELDSPLLDRPEV
jgi:uncharacterized protein YegP (UPF0339 family)